MCREVRTEKIEWAKLPGCCTVKMLRSVEKKKM
jgi:hypothetical protein